MKIKSKNSLHVFSVPGFQFFKNGSPETGHFRPMILASILLIALTTAGCQSTSGNTGHRPNYASSSIEAEWIRNVEPIEFESELLYPADGIEGFLDSEMRFMGTHKEVEFFIDKVDIRPFNRLYTKFDKNKFRYYEKRISE